MGRPPSPNRDKFIIRLPDGMRDQIKEAAEANSRTMTAEIVARLRITFDMNAETVARLEHTEQEDLEAPAKGMKFLQAAKQGSLAAHDKRLIELEDRIAALEDQLPKDGV